MTTTLENTASIHTGIYTTPNSWGDIVYLQAKDFNEAGQINNLLQLNLKMDEHNKINKHLLKNGDILFAAKGTKNFAAKYDKSVGPAVASSTFLVVRIQKEFQHRLLPDFLAWWLNHPQSQQYLKSHAIGSSLPSISKTVLQNLEIYLPPLSQQQAILKIHELRVQEKQLKARIEELREQQIRQLLLNVLTNKTPLHGKENHPEGH